MSNFFSVEGILLSLFILAATFGIGDNRNTLHEDAIEQLPGNGWNHLMTDQVGKTDEFRSFSQTLAVDSVLTMKTDSANVPCDSSHFTIPVTIQDTITLQSLQFSLMWDTSVVIFDSVQITGVSQNFQTGPDTIYDKLSFSWFGPPDASFVPGDSLLVLFFSRAGMAGDSTFVMFSSQPTVPQASVPGPMIIDMEFDSGLVRIVDQEPPSIDCPSDLTVTADSGACTNELVWDDPVVMDNCDPSPELTSNLVSDSLYEVGVYTIIYTATDTSGNVASCDFTGTVLDEEDPVITCLPDTILYTDSTQCFVDRSQLVLPSATDNCGIDTLFSNAGDSLVVGQHDILFIVVDESGNRDSCMQLVTVSDTIAPVISCIDTLTVATEPGACFALLDSLDIPGVLDNCQVDSIWVNGPDTLPLGMTTLTYMARDTSGNLDSCSTKVVVEDIEPPVIGCPSDMTIETDSGRCYTTNYTPDTLVVLDNCQVDTVFSNLPDTLLPGTTSVQYVAMDASGNTDSCTVEVTVIDTEPPVLVCPSDVTIETDTAVCFATNVMLDSVQVTDNCSVDTVFHNAPDTLFSGSTDIQYTAMDLSGNAGNCQFSVTVVDTEPPSLICPDNMTVETDSGVCYTVTVQLDMPQATDNCALDTVIHQGADTLFLGTTTMEFMASDTAGNTSTCSVEITVEDNELPVIVCPDDLTVTANMPGGAIVNNIDAIVSDNCGVETLMYRFTGATSGGSPMGAFNQPSGSFLNLGTTMVNYLVIDEAGNDAFCFTRVYVIPPIEITCPDDTVVTNETGLCSAPVFDIPVTIDSMGLGIDSVTFTITGATDTSGVEDASGTVFNVGVSTVQYIVYPDLGDPDTCAFTVEVTDTDVPVLMDCPEDLTLQAMANCQVQAFWDPPSATDNCPSPTLISSHSPGDLFGFGTTTVVYVATDSYGNADSCSFVVNVLDDVPPTIDCVDDLELQAADGQMSLPVNGIAAQNLSDNCGIDTVIFTLTGATTGIGSGDASGTFFNIGVTMVTYTVIDLAGNSIECSFTVTVLGPEVPEFDCPEDITVQTDSSFCTAQVFDLSLDIIGDSALIASIVYELEGDTPYVQDTLDASGSVFSLGTTQVTYTVTDTDGDIDSCQFTVTVQDGESPRITCPDDVVVFASRDSCEAIAEWDDPVFSDNCSDVSIDASHDSGDVFPVGGTEITYTATDSSGNIATCQFLVTVRDTMPPALVDCPEDLTLEVNDGTCEAELDWTEPNVTDNCPGVTVSSNFQPGDMLGVGNYNVTYTAIDGAGNRVTCSFNVTILDNEPPEINCPNDVVLTADGVVLSDINDIITGTLSDSCTGIFIEFESPEGMDLCGPAQTEQTDATGLTSGSLFPVGVTTLEYTVTDFSGNTSSCTFSIDVQEVDPLDISVSQSPVCEGDTLQLFAEGFGGATYEWSGPGDFSSTQQNPVINGVTANAEGVYTVTVTLPGGCVQTNSIAVDVIPSPDIDSLLINNSPICEGEDLQMLTVFIPGALYEWTGPDGFEANIYNPVIFDAGPENAGLYEVTIIYNGCGSPLTASFMAEIIPDPMQPVAVDDEYEGTAGEEVDMDVFENDTLSLDDLVIQIITAVTDGDLSSDGVGFFTYQPDEGFIGTDTFTYEVCQSNPCDVVLCDTAQVVIDVMPDEEDCTVFNTITPNGDDFNDEVYIPCLDVADPPESELLIYNEWGDEVFRASPYRNNWEGTHDGEPLPDGTYFYLLKIPALDVEDRGYITLFR